MKNTIQEEFEKHLTLINDTKDFVTSAVEKASATIISCLKNKQKILIIGNGGSAADAQHFSAELINRYKTERKALPAIALTTDSSVLTSIGNDYEYGVVFSRQIEALGDKDDVIFAISTSGNSTSIVNALKKAKEKQCITIGLSGNNGGLMDQFCDINIIIPSSDTPRIQEMHILVIHIICEIIDNNFKG